MKREGRGIEGSGRWGREVLFELFYPFKCMNLGRKIPFLRTFTKKRNNFKTSFKSQNKTQYKKNAHWTKYITKSKKYLNLCTNAAEPHQIRYYGI